MKSASQSEQSLGAAYRQPRVPGIGVDPRRLLSLLWPTLAVCAASIASQLHQGTTTDVAWLITLSERLLDGQTAYVDFFEVNPPASILLYVPAVFIARLLSLPPEFTVKASVYLLFFASVLLCRRIERRRWTDVAPGSRLAAYAAILLLLPGRDFAQREHFIAIALLPIAAVFSRRAEGARVGLLPAVIAGTMAGASIALKPHFALAVAAPWGFVVWSSRHPREAVLRSVFAPELIAAATVALGYLLVVWTCFPAFLKDMLPLVLDMYVVYRLSPVELLTSGNTLVWGAAAALTLRLAPARKSCPRRTVLLLSSVGCLAAWLIQGKSWTYQGYPAVALALVAFAELAVQRWQIVESSDTPPAIGSARRCVAPALLVALLAQSFVRFYTDAGGLDPLRAAMARLKPHPTMMAIGKCCYGHTVVREIGGRWVGHLSSTWYYVAAKDLLAQADVAPDLRRRLLGYVDLEKSLAAEDITHFRPDYILVAKDFATDPRDRSAVYNENWLRSTQPLRAAMTDYRPVADVDLPSEKLVVWGRRNDPSSAVRASVEAISGRGPATAERLRKL